MVLGFYFLPFPPRACFHLAATLKPAQKLHVPGISCGSRAIISQPSISSSQRQKDVLPQLDIHLSKNSAACVFTQLRPGLRERDRWDRWEVICDRARGEGEPSSPALTGKLLRLKSGSLLGSRALTSDSVMSMHPSQNKNIISRCQLLDSVHCFELFQADLAISNKISIITCPSYSDRLVFLINVQQEKINKAQSQFYMTKTIITNETWSRLMSYF